MKLVRAKTSLIYWITKLFPFIKKIFDSKEKENSGENWDAIIDNERENKLLINIRVQDEF